MDLREEILRILENKCPDLQLTETPASKCIRFNSKCVQLNCTIKTGIAAGKLVELFDKRREEG